MRPIDIPLLGERDVARAPLVHRLRPLLPLAGELLGLARELGAHFVGHVERRLERPAERFLRRLHFVGAERFSVRSRGAMQIRRAPSDDRLGDDDRRLVGDLLRFLDRLANLIAIVAVDSLRMPAGGVESFLHIL